MMAQPNGSTVPIHLGGTACWRKTWQTDSDIDLRRTVVEDILRLFQKRRGPVLLPEMQKILPDFVKRLEEALYRNAATKVEYADQQTLESRLRYVAKRMTSQPASRHRSQTTSSSKRDVSQSNFMQVCKAPEVSKRKQSDVVGSDEGQDQKIQRKHVSELNAFDTSHTAGAAQVDESNAEEVRDHQYSQESAAGSLEASYQEVGDVSLSPVIRPRAQPFQGDSREGIVNSGFGGNLDTQIGTIQKIGLGMRMLIKEQPDTFQHSETGLFKESPSNVTQSAEQAQEGIQFESGDYSISDIFWEDFWPKDFCMEDLFQVEQNSVSHETENQESPSKRHFGHLPSGILGGHPHDDSLADQAKYLGRVSPQNLICILKEAHKSFLEEEGLDRFSSLNWRLQEYEMKDLHEIIIYYNQNTLSSQWHNHAIDLGDDALAKIFPLPRTNKEPSFKATSFQSKFFPNDAIRRNGFLLSKCNNQMISERLKFLWETLHVRTVTPEIPHYIVRLLEESIREKNWFGYFIQGFRKELKKGKNRKKSQLGSHLSLVLAAQAPLVPKVEGASSGEEKTDSKTILLECDDNKVEIQIRKDEGQTLQAEGKALGAEDLTQEKEEREVISQCASMDDPSTSINDLKDEGQTLQAEGQALGVEDLTQGKKEREGTLLISQCASMDYPLTSMTNLRNSLDVLEKDIKATQSQKQRLENQRNTLRNENHKLRAEKEELIATRKREKEDSLEECRQKEKQLEEKYEAMLTQTKVKMSSAIKRQVEWVAEVERIQEANKKDVETVQVLLKEHKNVDEKLAMVEDLVNQLKKNKAQLDTDRARFEGLFNQVKKNKAQLDTDRKEMNEKLEADRAALEVRCKKKDVKLKLKLKANDAKLEGFQKEMDKNLKSSANKF